MTLRATLLTLILVAVTVPAAAQNDVYDNGPIDGQDYGWMVNYGLVTSNSFYFNNSNNCGFWGNDPCSVNGVSFAVWMFPGDVLYSAEVSITSSEYGGTTFFDQTVSFTQSGCFSNGSFNICTETGSFPDLYLNTGTYWLNLQNAVDGLDWPVYWDQNSGPSLASNTSVGTIPSESFTILGTATSYCYWCSTVPEPTGLGWLAMSVLGVLAFVGKRVVR